MIDFLALFFIIGAYTMGYLIGRYYGLSDWKERRKKR